MIQTSHAMLRGFGERIRRLAGAGALVTMALGGTMSAEAQTISYPRVIENGENKDIDYGPAGNQGPILGGGRVVVTGSGENVQVRYLDDQFVQRAPAGLLPITIGSGEGSTIAWIPAPPSFGSFAVAR